MASTASSVTRRRLSNSSSSSSLLGAGRPMARSRMLTAASWRIFSLRAPRMSPTRVQTASSACSRAVFFARFPAFTRTEASPPGCGEIPTAPKARAVGACPTSAGLALVGEGVSNGPTPPGVVTWGWVVGGGSSCARALPLLCEYAGLAVFPTLVATPGFPVSLDRAQHSGYAGAEGGQRHGACLRRGAEGKPLDLARFM